MAILSRVIIAVILFCVYGYGQSFFSYIYNSSPQVELENWQYRWGDSPKDQDGKLNWLSDTAYDFNSKDRNTCWRKIKDVNLISDAANKQVFNTSNKYEGRVIWLRTKLPKWNGFMPAIFIPFVKGKMEIYLDGKRIFEPENGFPGNLEYSKRRDILTTNYSWHLIKLPEDFQNKTIIFRIYSNNKGIGLSKPIFIGSLSNFTRQIILRDGDNIIIGTITILIGIMFLIILLFFQRNQLFFGMTLFFISSGAFIYINTAFIYLLIKNEYLLLYLNVLSMLLIPSIYIFIAELIDAKHKKLIQLPWRIHFAYIIISIILLQFHGITIIDLIDPFFILFAATVFYSVIVIIAIRKYQKWNFVLSTFLIGAAVYLICTFIEIGLYYFKNQHNMWSSDFLLFHWGVFTFLLAFIAVIIYRYLDIIKERDIVQKNMLQVQHPIVESMIKEKEVQKMFLRELIITQESERQRIAGELHDSIGQDLLIAKNKLMLDSAKQDENIIKVTQVLTHSIDDISRISHNMHPSELDDLGLTMAIEAMFDRAGEASGIKFNFNMDNIDQFIKKEDCINLFRIVQEATNNIMKHSKATEAAIRAYRIDSRLAIEVSDNGVGMNTIENKINGELCENTAQHGRPHFGLTSMKDRAELINGNLEITSQGIGTKVIITIKVEDNKEDPK